MNRHYFISDDLNDLDHIEEQLERRGIFKPQIHVLSQDDAGVALHKLLHNIESLLKQDIIHGTITGAIFGVFAAALLRAAEYFTNLPESYTFVPFYFPTIVVFGFITWSGGFYGIQIPNHAFRRFQIDLSKILKIKPQPLSRNQ